MAHIGANIADLHLQQTESTATADEAMEQQAEIERYTSDFQDDIQAMSLEAKEHMDTFAEMVKDASTRLKTNVDGTDWTGAAAEAKVARIEEVDGMVATFQGQMETAAGEFKTLLETVIDDFYAGITGEVRTTITAMNDTWTAEATHVRAMADELESLDQRAAGA